MRIQCEPLRAILILLALITGCTGQTVNVAGLPEDAQNELGAAVAEWNQAAPVNLTISYEGKANVHIQTLGSPEQPFVPSYDAWRLAGYTQARTSDSDIYLDPRLWAHGANAGKRKKTIMHEIGHLLGLHHAEVGLMSVDLFEFVCVDEATAGKLGGKGTCE